MSVSRLTATGVQVLDAGGTPAARLSGIGAQVLDAGGTPAARLTGIGAQVLVLDPDYQPIPGKVVLTWEEDNTSDTAHNVYHDTATMDPEALPAALASGLDPSLKKYEHVGTFSPTETQYYRVGVTNGSIEVISTETSVSAVGHVNAQLDVVLVVADDTHAATTNTKQALVDAGFDADRITVVEDSGTIPAGDVIVVCRALDTQADTDKVLAHWANGIPVVWGSADTTLGVGRQTGSTFADLTGAFEVVSNSPGIDGADITDATHYITSPFGTGQTVMFGGANYGYALDGGASFVGTKLADADPDNADVAGQASLIAVEAGTNDLVGNPTPARSVVWGNLYGNPTAYSADGVTLLSRIVQWCLGYDEFLN